MPCFAKIVASLVATDGFARPKEARDCSEPSASLLGANDAAATALYALSLRDALPTWASPL